MYIFLFQQISINNSKNNNADILITVFAGRKSGKGIYIYQSGQKNKEENTAAADLLKKYQIAPKLE